ncbi:MAG: ISAs1 family transposase [Rubripirellula sp.]
MQPAASRGLFAALQQVSDPRGRQGQRHPFAAMIAAVVCATLCGARGFKPIAQWLRTQEPQTWHWLGFKRRPPCANCFANLFKAIDADEFEQAIREWTNGLSDFKIDEENLKAISIDGKTLCGTLQQHQRAIHLLSALDHQTGYVLSQTQVHPQTNEEKTALVLLKNLVLQGKVVMADAMFCKRDVCEKILDSGGDYLIVVKENQPTLLREIELAFAETEGFSPLPAT